MEKIIVLKNKLQLKNLVPITNSVGESSKCYIYNETKILKKFNIPYDISDLYRFEKMCEIKNNTYVSPEYLFIYKDRLVAEMIKRIYSELLRNVFLDYTLTNFISIIRNVYFDTYLLSCDKIVAYDLHGDNILLNDKIDIIDMDEYNYLNHLSVDECYNKNMKSLEIAIQDVILSSLFKVIFSNRELNIMYEKYREQRFGYLDYNSNKLITLVSLLELINTYMKEVYNYNSPTFRDTKQLALKKY